MLPTTTENVDDPMAAARRLLESYPVSSRIEYGTAGFRCDASLLPPVVVRVGMFAAVRSACLGGEAVGVMITASHNPEGDNGVKLSDPNGGMLDPSWERHVVDVANDPTVDGCIGRLNDLLLKAEAEAEESNGRRRNVSRRDINDDRDDETSPRPRHSRRMVVHLGRDTRSHSDSLSDLVRRGAYALGGAFGRVVVLHDHGIVTTPMLHHAVMRANPHLLPNLLAISATERDDRGGYLDTLCRSYLALLRTIPDDDEDDDGSGGDHGGRGGVPPRPRELTVDCACGVGAPVVDALGRRMEDLYRGGDVDGGGGPLDGGEGGSHAYPPPTTFRVVNGVGDGPLNEACGAEHVQKTRSQPTVYHRGGGGFVADGYRDGAAGRRRGMWCSLDGDADRIVFHCVDEGGSFRLLDGDKIAVLVATFLRRELDSLTDAVDETAVGGGGGGGGEGGDASSKSSLRFGVVQTAYANGSSTAYLRDVAKIPVVIAKTGVKNVHRAAEENFDVGVYFEPNGHGTVLLGPNFHSFLADAERTLLPSRPGRTDVSLVALQRLRLLPSLVNQAIGDALSDMLLVDAILRIRGSDDFGAWDALYEDLPSRQCKVSVKDRSVITMNNNETRAVRPLELQRRLDSEMAALASSSTRGGPTSAVGAARCFVRPSGTEDVVRVYAEAPMQSEADALAERVATLVHVLCDGNGEPPKIRRSKL